jgi:hypothetical protein
MPAGLNTASKIRALTGFDSAEEEEGDAEKLETKQERRRARRRALKTWLQPAMVAGPDGTPIPVRGMHVADVSLY